MVTKFNTSTTSSLGLSTSDTPTFAGVNLGEDNLTVYDEGTWTPVMKIGSTTISTSATGKHIQIGKQVTVWFSIGLNRGTNTGVVTIEGLPVAPTMSGQGSVLLNDYVDGSPPILVNATSGGTVINLYVLPSSTGTQLGGMTDAHIAASTATSISGTITYYA